MKPVVPRPPRLLLGWYLRLARKKAYKILEVILSTSQFIEQGFTGFGQLTGWRRTNQYGMAYQLWRLRQYHLSGNSPERRPNNHNFAKPQRLDELNCISTNWSGNSSG
nr:hypothetical protein [Pseudomonas putida]